MSTETARQAILDALGDIAPEIDVETLDGAAALRDQIDLDSMDFLNIVIGVHRRLGIDIPEADYPKLATLDGFVAYVAERLDAAR